jgi:CBS-domain-containing membrane protein
LRGKLGRVIVKRGKKWLHATMIVIRRLPIINDRYQVVGIVSQADLARYAVAYQGRGERRAMADVLCAISKPTYTPYR